MSELKERKGLGFDYELGVRELNLRGVLDALGKSPAFGNFPPVLKSGTLTVGSVVVLEDGKSVRIETDKKTPALGSKVVVFEKAESYYYTHD